MKTALRFAALLVTAALLTQPLAAASACWQGDGSKASCPSPCSMSHESTKPTPVKAESADPNCCQISSSAPSAPATAAKSTDISRIQLAAPVASPLSLSKIDLGSAVRPVALAARASGSSLNVLYCVFLI